MAVRDSCRRLSARALAVALAALALGAHPAAAQAPEPGPRKATTAEQRDAVVAFARKQVGKPYVWGATGPRGFDCSGLIVAAYRSVGRTIPRTTSGQLGLRAPRRLKRGDLVFGLPGHVAMYIGAGRVIHAPAPGRRVQVASAAWHTRYARRTVFR